MVNDGELRRLWDEASSGRLSRRALLRRAAVLGLSGPVVASLVAACSGESATTPVSSAAATTTGGGGAATSTTSSGGSTPSSSGTTAAAASGVRKTLRFGWTAADIQTLDPHYASGTQDRAMVNMIYNGLVRFKPGDSKSFEPSLASEIPDPTTENGKQVWTFKLRKGVKWHKSPKTDSYELTADDVVWSMQKAADPKRSAYAGDYAGMTFEKVDDYTIKITLDQPVSPTLFLPKVADYSGGYIMSKKAFDAYGLDGIKTQPVGTAPFSFKSYTPQNAVELEAFDAFFLGKPLLAGVSNRFMPDSNSRQLALQNGEVDVISGLPEKQWVDQIQSAGDFVADVFGVGEVTFLNLNIENESLKDVRVRQAILYAINRTSHVALSGGEPVSKPVYSVVPADLMPGGLSKDKAESNGVAYDHNLDKAKQLMKDAGKENGFELTLVTSQNQDYKTNYETMQAELAKINIKIKLNVVDHPTYHAQIRKDVNPIVIYIAFRPNADTYLTQFFLSDSIVVTGSKPNTNFSHYNKIDDLIKQARYETDAKKQADLWMQANTQVLKDAAADGLMYVNQVYARAKKVNYGHDLISEISLYPGITEKTVIAS